MCKQCGENGHTSERCWELHPELKRVKKVQGVEGEEEELNLIDLGVLEIENDLPPVTREASGLSLTAQEVLALGGVIGYHADFYKTQKIRSGKVSTAWTHPQQCVCAPSPLSYGASNQTAAANRVLPVGCTKHNQAGPQIYEVGAQGDVLDVDRSTTGLTLPYFSIGAQLDTETFSKIYKTGAQLDAATG